MTERKPKRDHQGRWVKGGSGNPKGRPHKYARIDTGDLDRFFGTTIEVKNPDGRMTIMTREGAILHRLYQSAMKGNVHAQVFLARRYEKHLESKMGLVIQANRIMSEIDEQGRHPTDYEAYILNLLMAATDRERWGKDQGVTINVKKRRRRKRKNTSTKDDGTSNH